MQQYVNQDACDEPWRHIVTMASIEDKTTTIPSGVSTYEAILQNFFIDRLTINQIAKRYYKSRQYVNRIIHTHKSRMIKIIKKSVYNTP
jgi:hypothetical protein